MQTLPHGHLPTISRILRHSSTRYPRYFRSISSTAPTSSKPYYVTTPIFYVNAAPHIGHLHSLLLTDVLARYSRLRNPEREVKFATGTDEHGLKIQQVAKKDGKDPKAFCDEISERFKDLTRIANSSHTMFIRTTDSAHRVAVQDFWNRINQAGYIYKGSHSGWYAISDECYYTESQIEDRISPSTGEKEKVAIESGSVVEWTEEENYKFRLSEFREKLIEWLEADPLAVHPPTQHTALLNQLKTQPLADLSISRPRSRLSWGIPVPNDEEHTIYVWVDALTNYLTVLGYPWNEGVTGEEAGWPADVHVVGKDILRFHAVYWPALLLAAGLSPPRQILTHAHWTMNKSKMSKSKGNVADPFEAIEKLGVDVVRWYLMRVGGGLPVDADYSPSELQAHHRILAMQMGNLLSRISSPKLQKRFIAAVEKAESTVIVPVGEDVKIAEMLGSVRDRMEERMKRLEISRALEDVMDLVFEANKLLTVLEPWKATVSPSDLIRGMAYAHETLRVAGILLQPIMPDKTAELLSRLGALETERAWEAVGNSALDAREVVNRMKLAKVAKEPLFPLPPATEPA